MDFFSILALLGGLAVFLFGMNTMGEGLKKMSGGRLERVLETLTSNRLMAVLLGAGVTAILQSSSTTTVMTVGFVNSGMMSLEQAIGVVMGANIGTTITSWILSLSSIESTNFFLQIVKPENLAPMLAAIGIILILLKKSERQIDMGSFLLGLGLLLFGMEAMKNAVAPLAAVPEFTNILTMFSNPVLGVLAGALLTAVIQSSAASIGILLALSATGVVSFMTAVPIIMGLNIGTCATAMISGISAQKKGRRVAAVHLCIKTIGAVIFMAIFYTLNATVGLPFADRPVSAFEVALVHSIYNVFTTIVLFPFAKALKKLAYFIIKDDPAEAALENEFLILDSRFLSMPSVAIEHSKILADKMADLAKETLFTALSLWDEYDPEAVAKVYEMEETVDRYEDHLGTYLVQVSAHPMTDRDSKAVSEMVHIISDLERITDHALNIAQQAEQMKKKDYIFSKKAAEEVNVYMNLIRDIVTLTVIIFKEGDLEMAKDVEPMEEVCDEINREVKKRHLKRLRKGKCTIELGFSLSDLCTNLERISDHCSNIAVTLIQIDDDVYDVHEYASAAKEDEWFRMRVQQLMSLYVLPEMTKDEPSKDEAEAAALGKPEKAEKIEKAEKASKKSLKKEEKKDEKRVVKAVKKEEKKADKAEKRPAKTLKQADKEQKRDIKNDKKKQGTKP